MKQILKCAVCVFLIAGILSLTVSGDYYEARHCEAAEAAGAVTFSLIEKILLALGVTCTSMADLHQLTNRVNSANPYYSMTQEEIDAIGSMCYSDTIDFSIVGWRSAWDKLKVKVKALISDKDVSKNDMAPNYGAETVSVEYHNGLLSKEQLFSLFGNTPVRGKIVSSGEYVYGDDINMPKEFFYGMQAVKVSNLSSGGVTVSVIMPNRDLQESGVYVQRADNGCCLCRKSSGNVLKVSDVGGSRIMRFQKAYADSEYFEVYGGMDEKDMTPGRASGQVGETASLLGDGTFTVGFCDAVYSLKGTYTSFDDFVLTNTAIKDFPLSGDIVGNTGSAIDDTKPINVPAGSVTTTVENYIINNPGVTADELNDYVGALIPTITDVSDKVDDATEEIAAGNTWLEKIYNYIKSKMNVTMSSVQSSIVAVGGTSEDILDESKKTSKKLSTVGSWLPGLIMEGIFQVWDSVEHKKFRDDLFSKLDEIKSILTAIAGKNFSPVVNVSPPSVEAPDPQVTVNVPAPQVTVENGTDLSGIERFLSSILTALGSMEGKLDAVPGKIDALIAEVSALPGKIAEPVINVTAEVPDVIVPEIKVPEIEVSQTQITNTVKEVFLIQPDRVHADADRLLKSYSSHFPDLKLLLGIILLFSFPSEVEYPVFEIATPEILKSYVGSDSIVLLDCEDYSIYFSWTRNLIRAFIWIHFIYSIFGHFKVRFTVS